MEAQRRQSGSKRASRRLARAPLSRPSVRWRPRRPDDHLKPQHRALLAPLLARQAAQKASSAPGLVAGPLVPRDLPLARRRSREACPYCRRKPQGPLPARCPRALRSAQKRRLGRASRPSPPPGRRHCHQRVPARFAGWRRARQSRFLGRRRATRCRAPASRTRYPRRRPALSSRLYLPARRPSYGASLPSPGSHRSGRQKRPRA